MEKLDYDNLLTDKLKEEDGKLIFTYEVEEKKEEKEKEEPKK